MEANPVKRNFTLTASPARKRTRIYMPMENEAPVRKIKPVIIGDMDVNSELS